MEPAVGCRAITDSWLGQFKAGGSMCVVLQGSSEGGWFLVSRVTFVDSILVLWNTLTNVFRFSIAGIPPRTRGTALADLDRRLKKVPVEERDIKALVTDANFLVFGLLHLGHSTGKAPVVLEEDVVQDGEEADVGPGGEAEAQVEEETG